MKATRYIAAIALLAGLMSCQREKELADLVDGTCPEGFVEVTISAGMPEPVAPSTRAKMGEGASQDEFDLYLCLYGPGEGFVQNWIPTTPVRFYTDPVTGYVTKVDYKAQLPITDEKRVVHLIVNPPVEANPTLTDYMDNVMEMMVDTNNECSYWQQVILPNGIQSQVVGGKVVVDDETAALLRNVKLVRDFVKLTVTSANPYLDPTQWDDPETPKENPEYEGFTVKQWTVINVPSMGYVAPYTGNKTEATRFPSGYLNISNYTTGPALYAQLTGKEAGQDDYKGSIPSTATIIDTFPGDPATAETGTYAQKDGALYFYERPLPTSAQKQTAILCEIEFDPGHALNPTTEKISYWYKIEVLDDKGKYVPFLRDIVYRMIIKGVESEGAETALEAYNGSYFGNISASLETATLNELSNGTSLIHVDLMDYTFMQGSTDEVTKTELLMNGDQAAQFYFIPFIAGDEERGVPAGQKYTVTTDGICEIEVTIEEVEGYSPSVTAVEDNCTEGAGTIRVTLAQTDPNHVKKSVIRVSGTADGGKAIYREITVNLMSRQEFKHTYPDPDGLVWTAIVEQPEKPSDPETCGINKLVKINLQLPEDLGASLFPLQIRIEAENNVLSATSPDLPVTTGKSVFDPNRNTFFYVKTIKWSDYCKLNSRTKKYEYFYSFDCNFYTTKTGDNSSKIDVRDMKGTEQFAPLELELADIASVDPEP